MSGPMVRGGVGDHGRERRHLVPMVDWIRSYDRRWLKGDLVAGIAVAALIVPKNLGYAAIAGVPLQNGLYAAAAGAIIYAVFGTSRQISTGPSSGLAAVAASAVLAATITGTQDVASFVATITLASGLLFLLLAVFRMGWIAQFLSRAVVTGFLFGAAIDVVIGELPKLTGTDASGANALQELRSWFGSLGDSQLGNGARWRHFARRHLRSARRSRHGSPERSCCWSGASWPHGSSISAPTASPSWATCREGSRASRSRSGNK